MLEVRTIEIDTDAGKQRITGATVQSLRNALASADPNAVVSFGFEVTHEVRFLADNSELLLGAVCFVGYAENTVMLLGAEAVNAVKKAAEGEQ